MKVLVILLTYGNRPKDILYDNILNAGYPAEYIEVSVEGIANALNTGIDLMTDHDAIAFLANDIAEPVDWLKKKTEAIQSYPEAALVASSLDFVRTEIANEMIISNWLIPKSTIEKIGYFNESMFPYGPIDLDYCERCYVAGLKTYYVKNCLAIHKGAEQDYGWNKAELVSKYDEQYNSDVASYRNGTKNYYNGKK